MKKKNFNTIIAAWMMGISLVIFLSMQLPGMEKIDKDKILATSQEWKDNYMYYHLDDALLETLKTKIGENLKIDVYLGTWCSDSLNNVPKFIKIIEAAAAENLPVNYYNVERKPGKEVKYFVEDLKVE